MLYWALSSKIRCTLAEHGVDTNALLWRIAVWDMRCCFLGEFDNADWLGNPWPEGHPRKRKSGRICGPYFMAWWQFASDDEYLANYLRLPHWNNPSPCVFCNCTSNDSNNPWTDFRPDARWQRELKTLEQWEANPTPHPLWLAYAVLGLTVFHVCIDELHNGAFGILRNTFGSAIWVCVHFANIPGRFSTRVSTVWSYLYQGYDEQDVEHRLRVPYFKFLGVFGRQTGCSPSDWPTLGCKAAQARHCLTAMTSVCDRIAHDYNVGDVEFRLLRYALHRLVRFYSILHQHGHHMQRAAGEECFQKMKEFLRAQNAFGQHYRNKDQWLERYETTVTQFVHPNNQKAHGRSK